MKTFCLFLALWTLTLSGWPCLDDCHRAGQSTETAHSEEDSATEEGACSPFCACSTGHGFMAGVAPTRVERPEPLGIFVSGIQYFFRLAALPEGSAHFWQPPKI